MMEMNSKTRVLVLDDEAIVGERLKASLELAGFDVVALSSSREALAKLEAERFDILVTDVCARE
jgi:DNA-binding NtrC family response regulator